MYLERKERRDPPKFIEQLIDIGVFECKHIFYVITIIFSFLFLMLELHYSFSC